METKVKGAPLFTVILCTYNGGAKIGRAIEALLRQEDYGRLVDRFVIVDNNSTDQTGKVIADFLSDKKNKAEYVLEKRQGLSYARLAGVKRALSQWIVFIDDDNYMRGTNWLLSAEAYIKRNPKLGAFNGVCVPFFQEPLSHEEQEILEAAYRGLACTHLDMEDARNHPVDEGNWMPFGAGLVIRAQPLLEMADRGWLKSPGRTGDSVISGEDTEMCGYVAGKGYVFGFNSEMILEHDLGRKRLGREYIFKLYDSFSDAFISQRKRYVLGRLWLLWVYSKTWCFCRIREVCRRSNFKNELEKHSAGYAVKRIGRDLFCKNGRRREV